MKRHYQTKNNVLTTALELPYFERIFQKYDVIMVVLGGSQLAGLESEQSDYDLNFFVANDCEYQRLVENWCIRIDDKDIHAYICPLRTIECSFTGFSTSLIKQNQMKKQDIIWYNPKYQHFIDTYFDLLPQLAMIGMLRYKECLGNNQPWKNAYSYMLGANWLLGANYDINEIRYYKANYNKLTSSEQDYYYGIINDISRKLDQTEGDWKALWNPIYELLKKTLC